MEGQAQYFVVFKPQKGEIIPSYSFVDQETFDEIIEQDIVAKGFPVSQSAVHSKEEVMELLQRYKNEK